MLKKIIFFVLIIMCLVCLCGCSLKDEENRTIEEKIDSEIEYIENTIFAIANKQIKDEYIENNEFNWNLVKHDVQKINDSWVTLELDFIKIDVENEKIVKCSNCINNLLLSVSQKDEIVLLEELYNINENLYEIKDGYTEDKNYVEKLKLKGEILKIYYMSYQKDYDIAYSEINNLQENYKKLMNDENYRKENSYNLNKVALLIEEYKIAIETKNINLIKIKYLNLIEKI